MPIFNPPPTAVPTAHHTTHETGGTDLVAAIDGSVITTGSVAAARGGTGTTTGLTVLSASNVTTGTLPVAQLPATAARTDLANNFAVTGNVFSNNGASIVYLSDTSQPANQRSFRLMNATQVLAFQPTDDAGNWSVGCSVSRLGDVYVGRDCYEKGRTSPLGHWVTVPFNAANFLGTSGMTWTVTAGNVANNRYCLIGRTLIWSLYISTSTLGGTASGALELAIPGGYTCAFYNPGAVLCGQSSFATVAPLLLWSSTAVRINLPAAATLGADFRVLFTAALEI